MDGELCLVAPATFTFCRDTCVCIQVEQCKKSMVLLCTVVYKWKLLSAVKDYSLCPKISAIFLSLTKYI